MMFLMRVEKSTKFESMHRRKCTKNESDSRLGKQIGKYRLAERMFGNIQKKWPVDIRRRNKERPRKMTFDL